MFDTVIYEFNGGAGDILFVYEDRVVIKHKGFLNFLAMGIKGDKTLYYCDITAVEYKKPGWTAGRIQFTLPGGRENTGGSFAAASDENTITFNGDKKIIEQAEKVVNYINAKLKEVKSNKGVVTGAPSAADELLKFKQLLDAGIITKEEFEIKKKQFLGM